MNYNQIEADSRMDACKAFMVSCRFDVVVKPNHLVINVVNTNKKPCIRLLRLYWPFCRCSAAFAALIVSLSLLLSGCASVFKPVQLEIQPYASENQNNRVRFVVLHYTVGNFAQSLQALTQKSAKPVSSHYLIPESFDNSYGDKPLRVYQLVAESERAWHAGESAFEDRQNLNDQSIGIELVNRGYCVSQTATQQQTEEQQTAQQRTEKQYAEQTQSSQAQLCLTPDFDPAQMQLLALLLKDIVKRYPDISPTRILAHSDIAPTKKQDPGARFPWQWLAQQGIGAWYDEQTVQFYYQQPVLNNNIRLLQQALKIYGYAIEITGEHDSQSKLYLSAFQRHFVPEQITGQPDDKSIAVLSALLAKYRPVEFQLLLRQQLR